MGKILRHKVAAEGAHLAVPVGKLHPGIGLGKSAGLIQMPYFAVDI
jgi:hypothetical protein